jgi:hypothetical protein
MSNTDIMDVLNKKIKSQSDSIPISSNKPDPKVYVDLSQSVGGTIYATTPGGTRYKYKRNEMMGLRFSPQSKTPPINLPIIPGVTKKSIEGESPIIKLSKKELEEILEGQKEVQKEKQENHEDDLMFGNMD